MRFNFPSSVVTSGSGASNTYVDAAVSALQTQLTTTSGAVSTLQPLVQNAVDTVTALGPTLNTATSDITALQTALDTTNSTISTLQTTVAAIPTVAPDTTRVGDIVVSTVATPPTGYIRANGAAVNKTTYADLFAVIGETYAPSLAGVGNGQPWRQQYDINTANGTIGTWVTSGISLPEIMDFFQAIITKNRVYIFGSYNTQQTYYANIDANGVIGTWIAGSATPVILSYPTAIVTNSRVYILGGYNSAAVYYAPIDVNGVLGAWVTDTSLPGPLGISQAIVTSSYVYMLGGWNSSTVYRAPVSAAGVIGTWTTDTSLPGILAYSQVVITKDRVYLLGGYNDVGPTSTVYTAPINVDGTVGTWVIGTSLPGTLRHSSHITTKDRVYLLGGAYNGVSTSNILSASIDENGIIGTWSVTGTLPVVIQITQAIVTSSRIYLLGNDIGVNVYYAPFTGGLNDYRSGQITNPTTFLLPDYTTVETSTTAIQEYTYIKATV